MQRLSDGSLASRTLFAQLPRLDGPVVDCARGNGFVYNAK